MEEHNYLNNQFALKMHLGSEIIEYCLEHKLDINYIGFIKIGDHIITTNIKKRPDNGFRCITIGSNTNQNNIIDHRKYGGNNFIQFDITFNKVNIKVSKQYDSLLFIEQYLAQPIFDIGKVKLNPILTHIIDDTNNGIYTDLTKYDKDRILDFHTVYTTKPDILSVASCNTLYYGSSVEYYRDYGGIEGICKWYNINKELCKIVANSITRTIPIKNVTVENLYFGDDYNYKLYPGSLISVKHLTFGRCFNQKIKQGVLPLLESLTFGRIYDQPIESLPPTLKTLVFGRNYDRKIDLSNLVLLENLTFGIFFNQIIDFKPLVSLKTLTFGLYYDSQLDVATLSKSLIKLTIPFTLTRFKNKEKKWFDVEYV